jgi:hypothetical protein
LALATTGLLVVLAAGGCSGKSDDTIASRPGNGGDGGGGAPTEGTPAVGPIVASIESAGGLAGDQASSNLIFELHDDGTVFTSAGADDGEGTDGGGFGLASYKLNGDGLDRANELLGQIEVDASKYGEPSISDMPSTSFSLRIDGGAGPAEEMSVYALDGLPDDAGNLGLSGAQQEARETLLGILDSLTALSDEAALVETEPAAYTPTDLDIAFIPVFTDEGATPAEPLQWPLGTALTEMQLGWDGVRPCTGIHGEDTATLIEAMGIEAPGPQEAPWSTGAAGDAIAPRQVMAQVEVVLPQHPSCTAQPEPDVPPDSPPLLDGGPFYPIQMVDMFDWHGTFEADERRKAEPLEIYVALPAIAVGATSRLGVTDADLSRYDYVATASTKGGTTFLELGALEPGEQEPLDADWAWEARVDLGTGELVVIEEI